MTRGVLFALVLTACGESKPETRSPPADEPLISPVCAAEPLPTCLDTVGEFYCPDTVGLPFLAALHSQDERSSSAVSVPEAGKICLTGTLAAVAAEQGDPYAELGLGLEEHSVDGKCFLPLVDARAFGATSLRFRLDKVPDTHLYLTAWVVQRAECPEGPFGCVVGGGYTALTHDRDDLLLLEPGVNVVPFEDFVGHDQSVPLDASRLSLFTVRLRPTNRALDFDFCLSDFAFLDASGHEVAPLPLGQ